MTMETPIWDHRMGLFNARMSLRLPRRLPGAGCHWMFPGNVLHFAQKDGKKNTENPVKHGRVTNRNWTLPLN